MVLFLGLPRIYVKPAIIREVGYPSVFFLSCIVFQAILHKLEIELVVKVVSLSAKIVVLLHALLFISDIGTIGLYGNYIGIFANKFMAASTLYVAGIYLFAEYITTKNKMPLAFMVVCTIFLSLTFRRLEIVAFFSLLVFYLYSIKKVKPIALFLLCFVIIISIIPIELYSEYYNGKLLKEYNFLLDRDYERLGSKRVENYLLGVKLFEGSAFINKIFGYGAAYSYKLSEITWRTTTYAHGHWIATLIDYGVVGVVVFTAFFTVIYKRISHCYNRKLYNPEFLLLMKSIIISIMIFTLFGNFLTYSGTMVLLTPFLSFPAILKK